MAPKIFLTGVTGYIGGDVFSELFKRHPEYEYTLLVRNQDRGRLVTDKYPNVRLVYGTLSNSEVLEKEAAAADVVVHAANSADDAPSAEAISRGITSGHSAESPGYWIHTTGTALLQWYDMAHKRYGQSPNPDECYHDIASVDKITKFPDDAPHRNIDKIVLATNSERVKTAMVSPCTIFGQGRGPVNKRSIQVPDLAKFTLEKGYAPIIAPGYSKWNDVHIHDLSQFFVLLVEAALDVEKRKNQEVFGPRAYYFLENGVHAWSEVSRWVAEEAAHQGYLSEPMTREVEAEVVEAAEGVSNLSWGMNSICIGERAKKYLGWAAHGCSLKDEIPATVKEEARRLGIKPR